MSGKNETDGRAEPATVDTAADDLFDLLGDDLDTFDQEERESRPEDDQTSDEPEDEEDETEAEAEDEDSEDEEEVDADEESVEDDEETEDAELHEVKVDGKEESVTLDELKGGYSRTATWTRKMQQLAEDRKVLEGELAQTRVARNKYGDQLANLSELIEQASPSQPDWDKLRVENPDEYAIRYVEFQRHEESKKLAIEERERIVLESQQEFQGQLAQKMVEEREKLELALPEWTDKETGTAERQKLFDYLVSDYGYSQEQLSQVVDHRALLMARKAMLYDELDTKGRKAIAGKKKKTVALKPGQPKPRMRTKKSQKQAKAARKRLEKSGRIDDAANILLDMEETEL